MSFVQLLLLLRKLPFRDLLDYPDDLRDEEGVRRWLEAVAETGTVLSDLTETKIDDAVIDGFADIVSNPEAFGTIYGIILSIFSNEEEGFYNPYIGSEDTKRAVALTGFSPTLIIAIVQIVVMLLRFIRDRRNG